MSFFIFLRSLVIILSFLLINKLLEPFLHCFFSLGDPGAKTRSGSRDIRKLDPDPDKFENRIRIRNHVCMKGLPSIRKIGGSGCCGLMQTSVRQNNNNIHIFINITIMYCDCNNAGYLLLPPLYTYSNFLSLL